MNKEQGTMKNYFAKATIADRATNPIQKKLGEGGDVTVGGTTYRLEAHRGSIHRRKSTAPNAAWIKYANYYTPEELSKAWEEIKVRSGNSEPQVAAEDGGGVDAESGALQRVDDVASVTRRRGDAGETGMMDAGRMPEMVTEQWRRAQEGLLEILRFGAMLHEVKGMLERVVPRDNALPGHGWNKGTGLKGWLEEHCPEVNYFTARGYMAAVEGLKKTAQVREEAPLLALMGEPDGKAEAVDAETRERVMETIGNSSLRLLREAGRHASERLSGRPRGSGKGEEAREGITPRQRRELAEGKLENLLIKFNLFLQSDSFLLVPLENRQRAARALKDYAKILES